MQGLRTYARCFADVDREIGLCSVQRESVRHKRVHLTSRIDRQKSSNVSGGSEELPAHVDVSRDGRVVHRKSREDGSNRSARSRGPV